MLNILEADTEDRETVGDYLDTVDDNQDTLEWDAAVWDQ